MSSSSVCFVIWKVKKVGDKCNYLDLESGKCNFEIPQGGMWNHPNLLFSRVYKVLYPFEIGQEFY